ncbi:HAMP domain-containing protein [Mariprofundus erugo]|uniref:HAMP domain-containing protein n=1 Tax=Mariprofundus erugo TaxID=2528639 RepID=A0A5R9GSC7_9PROT|nr:methyl-accepting chemotaxis protein [Mariprofundus erugo]TLS67965.1 HAMP domain-containing protein [Mariprofundus erugo]TLS76729.1 HAMP domain-containing protein [Mariprofundus erugo]
MLKSFTTKASLFILIILMSTALAVVGFTALSVMNLDNNHALLISLMAIALAIGLASLIGFQLMRNISRSLTVAQNAAAAIARGDLTSDIDIGRHDEMGGLMESLKTVQQSMRATVGEIKAVVEAAAMRGDFSTRMKTSGKEGYTRELAELLNRLSEVTETGLQDMTRVTTALANGDLTQKITNEYPGLFGKSRDSINNTVIELSKIVEDVLHIGLCAGQGDFTVRADMKGRKGYAKTLAELLNQLSDITESGLKDIMHVANLLARGDLTQTIARDYPGLFGQTKEGINATTENLRTLVDGIMNAAESINTGTVDIAKGNQNLSQRTESQASSLEETASSLEELTSTVKLNADNARQANQLAIRSSDIAIRGGAVVGEVVTTMNEINEASNKIVDIISVIDGIAFQTNLLALNAAVEAARAGEQGRGFAVVASEVRNLAQRSSEAAKEIKGLIDNSAQKVENGSKLVAKAGETMEEIVTSIKQVTDIMGEITTASSEQSIGIEQVHQAVAQMDTMTQQNAALVEQAAAAAETLEEEADRLNNSVAAFKIDRTAVSKIDTGSAAIWKTSHFNEAILAHLKWKKRLHDFINGSSTEKLDSAVICKDNLCILGKWIYGDGKAHSNTVHYPDLVRKHASFHLCAGEVVRKAEANQKSASLDMLHGEFANRAQDTIMAIIALKDEIE